MEIDWDAMLRKSVEPATTKPKTDQVEQSTLPESVVDEEIGAREQAGDDRRRCTECRNLAERGVCLAAQRGEIVAARGYTPVPDILRRCVGFSPLETDPDQRHGRDKWQSLNVGRPLE